MPVLPGEQTSSDFGVPHVDAWAVEDPTTDVSAAIFDAVASSVAAMTHTACRAWVAITGHATTPTVAAHGSNWGNSGGVAPTLTRNGAGDITITWPTSVTAEDGTTATLNLRYVTSVVLQGGTTPFMFTANCPSSNTARVRLWSATVAAGSTVAASDFAGSVIFLAVI